MRLLKSLGIFILACRASVALRIRDHDSYDYFSVHLKSSVSPYAIADALEAKCEGPIGELPDHYTFSTSKSRSAHVQNTLDDLKKRRRKRDAILSESRTHDKRATLLEGIRWSEKQRLKPRLVKRIPPPLPSLNERQGPPPGQSPPTLEEQQAVELRLNETMDVLKITDPIFRDQWHLLNTKEIGHDMNVTGVWLAGNTGKGSISAIIDDGLDMDSDDLKDNYYAEGSHDFNDEGEEPRPRLFDDKHGTRCAGEVAAVKNDVCGVGMAYDSKIAGIRILSKVISDEDEAIAVNYGFKETQIYSCSWGPPDDGQTMETPGILIQRAMANGVERGRDSLGSVFVFAAGNGASSEDNCNFDGYTNSIYSITVGAIDRNGNHPYYSESCSAVMVVTYSSGGSDAIHTTDVGENKCYTGHGGTSAAGPLHVGTIALALSERPDLNWRDLQYISIESAIPIHEDDGSWQETKIGKKFSHMYGYGKVDTWKFVEVAKDWKSVKRQAWYHSPWLSVQHPIPEGDQGLVSSFEVTEDILKDANLERLEHVTVTMNVNHTKRGDLSVELKSPEGIVSHLSTTRSMDAAAEGYIDWTFMSVAHWGEKGIGNWTVVVKDTVENEFNGTFIDWRLNLWGESVFGGIQKLHPLPDEHDDDHETLPATVGTTSVSVGPSTTSAVGNPTDHIDRPVNVKPTSTSTTEAPADATSEPSGIEPSPSPTQTASDSFLPAFFPTFGVSKRTQIWIYGSIGLIIVFCSALGVYFYLQRKKRLRNNLRDDYEFEILDDDEDGHGGMNGHAKGKKSKRRAGELYDAFAGESDEEVFSDAEDEPYRDAPEEKHGPEDEKRANSK